MHRFHADKESVAFVVAAAVIRHNKASLNLRTYVASQGCHVVNWCIWNRDEIRSGGKYFLVGVRISSLLYCTTEVLIVERDNNGCLLHTRVLGSGLWVRLKVPFGFLPHSCHTFSETCMYICPYFEGNYCSTVVREKPLRCPTHACLRRTSHHRPPQDAYTAAAMESASAYLRS